jgi:hypothetical protein
MWSITKKAVKSRRSMQLALNLAEKWQNALAYSSKRV